MPVNDRKFSRHDNLKVIQELNPPVFEAENVINRLEGEADQFRGFGLVVAGEAVFMIAGLVNFQRLGKLVVDEIKEINKYFHFPVEIALATRRPV